MPALPASRCPAGEPRDACAPSYGRQDACAPSAKMLGESAREGAGAAADFQYVITVRREMPEQEVVIVIVVSGAVFGGERGKGDAIEVVLNCRHA